MKRGYMDWDKNLLPLSALEERRQSLMKEAAKMNVQAVVVYGDVYSADELSYYVNYAPYWCNSVAVITEKEVYMVTGHNNRVNPWIHTLTGIEEEKLLASGFKVPARTAQSLKERFPQGGRIGMIGKYIMADLGDALKVQGFELVAIDDIQTKLMQTTDDSYREMVSKAAVILHQAFERGAEEYARGGSSKTVTAEIEYGARKNGAMDIVLYVSHEGNSFGLPVTMEDAGGKWTVCGLMQYLGVWVKLTKTFGAVTTAVDRQLEAVALELLPGRAVPCGAEGFEIIVEQVLSDVISDLNQATCEIITDQVLYVAVHEKKSGICCSNMYRITEKGAVVL